MPRCLLRDAKCEALLADLDDDGDDDIVLYPVPQGGPATAFAQNAGVWSVLGTISGIECKGVREALKTGTVAIVPPTLRDLEINGQRLRVSARRECVDMPAPTPAPGEAPIVAPAPAPIP